MNVDQVVRLGYHEKIHLTPPIKYGGEEISIHLSIFARDLPLTAITIGYSKTEIENLIKKLFTNSIKDQSET